MGKFFEFAVAAVCLLFGGIYYIGAVGGAIVSLLTPTVSQEEPSLDRLFRRLTPIAVVAEGIILIVQAHKHLGLIGMSAVVTFTGLVSFGAAFLAMGGTVSHCE